MAKVLVVDGNPDHLRLLGGLLRYRTSHQVTVVETCVAGARAAVSDPPDVIMINALLFMGSQYAFPRVLQQNPRTASIPFLVHATGSLGEITQKQIEASGVAGVVELPISADELEAEIIRALGGSSVLPSGSGGIQPVQWTRMTAEAPTRSSASKPVPKPVGDNNRAAPHQARETHRGRVVQSVDWAAIGRRPAAGGKTGDGDRKMDATGPGSGAFQSASYDVVDPQEARGGKGGKQQPFRDAHWGKADPDQVKNRLRE